MRLSLEGKKIAAHMTRASAFPDLALCVQKKMDPGVFRRF
jgi:hypothetical protein